MFFSNVSTCWSVTAALQSIKGEKCMKFKDLFCRCIIENEMFYIKNYVFKTFKLQLPADLGG